MPECGMKRANSERGAGSIGCYAALPWFPSADTGYQETCSEAIDLAKTKSADGRRGK